MCGIVGCIGDEKALNYLIGGLHRLEYRGYDSAGIVTIGKKGATLIRAKGKVAELEALTNKKPLLDTIGIGHTRWATHGEPSVINVVQQLFAYYVAVARGNDVDQPRNLAKSVTVE